MKIVIVVLLSAFTLCVAKPKFEKFVYPQVRRDNTIEDDYHGTKIKDPYRWLEDPDSEETQKFVREQNEVTNAFIGKCKVRDQIRQRLTELRNYPKYGAPQKSGDHYYFYLNTGLQNQSVLYYQESLDSQPKEFLDPNKLSTDGTIALSLTSHSDDGSLFAYAVSKSGSDWSTIYIRNVSTGQDFPEKLENVKFSDISWTNDNKGFFYSRYPVSKVDKVDGQETTTNTNHQIHYHYVGTDQSQDILAVEFPDHPKWTVTGQVTDDGDYLLVTASEVIGEDNLYYVDLKPIKHGYAFKSKLTLVPLAVATESSYTYVANDGSLMYFITDNDAPMYRLVRVDLNRPQMKYWSTVIPESRTDVLSWANSIDQDKIIVSYIHDVKDTMELRWLNNGSLIKEFEIPVGSIKSISGEREDTEFFFKFNSYTNPGIIYHVNLTESLEPQVWKDIPIKGYNSSDYIVKQVFYPSKDGTKVPMFIFHRKGLELKGHSPCLLYAYGGFSVSLQPYFSTSYVAFMQIFDGVVAIPNLRGGGEYGKKWWDEGRLLNKQNGFDDFSSAAEFLISNNYTCSSKLTIEGGSNGGLLMGASVNQRPELFGAVFADVGVLDMLRFQKFTIGHAWCGEYGCSDDPEHFANLIKYSPLHNIRMPANESVQYPAVMVLTADHDDRVVPLHSYKFISELQYTVGSNKRQENPLMIRIESKAGHGAGKPTAKQILETTDQYSFLVETLGYEYKN